MPELLDQLLGWLAGNPIWSGLIIFAVAFGESLAVVGILVPGAMLMFGFGALITSGVLEFWPVYAWSVCGAIAGDGLSYWLGCHYRDRLHRLWPFNKHPEMLDRGNKFFLRYGGKSVAIGRFFGPVRAVIPLVAGMMKMPPQRFYLANIASALVWSPAYLLPGMAFGMALELATEVAFNLVLTLILLVVLIWLTITAVHSVTVWLQPRSAQVVSQLLRLAHGIPVLSTIGDAISDPKHPEYRALGLFSSLLLMTMIGFTLMTTAILQNDLFNALDEWIFNGLQLIGTPWADAMFSYLDQIAGITAIVLVQISVGFHLLWERHQRAFVHWLAAVIFSHLAPSLIHLILQSPGPLLIADEPYWSYPSAEIVRATVTFGFLAVLISRSVRPSKRWWPYGLTSLVLIGIALAQLYLGICWFSDLAAGIMLSLIWVGALGLAYYRHAPAESHGVRLGLSATGILVLSLALPYNTLYDRSLPETVKQPLQWIELQTWLDDRLSLPVKRHDSSGSQTHPLMLQYAGESQPLISHLKVQGWHQAEKLDWRNSLRLWSTDISLDQLPLLPHVHDGRFEQVTLVKPQGSAGRWVLRLWSTAYRLEPTGRPLWVGQASVQYMTDLLGLVHYARTEPDDSTALKALEHDMAPFGLARETSEVLKLAIPPVQ